MKNVLANRSGIALVVTLMMGSGDMCPKCGYGTRVTSKRWAKCKQCGERVPRRNMDDVAGELRTRIESSLEAEQPSPSSQTD